MPTMSLLITEVVALFKLGTAGLVYGLVTLFGYPQMVQAQEAVAGDSFVLRAPRLGRSLGIGRRSP